MIRFCVTSLHFHWLCDTSFHHLIAFSPPPILCCKTCNISDRMWWKLLTCRTLTDWIIGDRRSTNSFSFSYYCTLRIFAVISRAQLLWPNVNAALSQHTDPAIHQTFCYFALTRPNCSLSASLPVLIASLSVARPPSLMESDRHRDSLDR